MITANYGQYAINFYLDYFNNYLTVAGIAEYYNYSLATAQRLIARGKELYELTLNNRS